VTTLHSTLPTLVLLWLSLLTGCGRATPSKAPAQVDAHAALRGSDAAHARPTDAAIDAASSDVPLLRARRKLMSTIYEISLVAPDEPRAHAALNAALDEVARLEQVLSEWLPDSEVSRINAAAGKSAVVVGPDTMANIRAGLEAARWSEGAFDITWAALRSFYLFQPDQRPVPDLAAVRKQRRLVNYRDVRVNERESSVMLQRRGMAIGLGGIAKGWAVDRASAILQAAGYPNHMVFAGGQVLMHGMRGDRKWRIGIQHPRAPSYFAVLEASDVSIATSGDYEHAYVAADGSRWHHIIDLETGLPATRSTSVTVVAPSGLLADAVDTGCFIMGPERCLKMLASLPVKIEAVIVGPDMKLYTTPGTEQRLVMQVQLDPEGRIPSGERSGSESTPSFAR
jgi:FAD:protein FMN transferase